MAKGKKGFQPGNRFGTRFSRDRQPKKNGRKPSLYKRINLPGKELSKEDYTNIMLSLMECTVGQLERIRNDCHKPGSKLPVWIATMIIAIFHDIRKGSLDSFRWVMDRSFGKAQSTGSTQINILNNNGVIFNFSALSDAELLMFNTLLNKMEGKTTGSLIIDQDLEVPG